MKIRDFCLDFYEKTKNILNPGLRNSQYYYKDTLKRYLTEGLRWLDVGCGHQIFPEWMPLAAEEQTSLVKRSQIAIGTDYDFLSLKRHKYFKYKVAGDSCQLPFKNASFNIVTCNMVVEHINNPSLFLEEISRTLRFNGILIIHTQIC